MVLVGFSGSQWSVGSISGVHKVVEGGGSVVDFLGPLLYLVAKKILLLI